MQPEQIIVIPPTHEQTAPAFHVAGSLISDFYSFLQTRGLTAWEPPRQLEKTGPDQLPVIEIEVEAGTPTSEMEHIVSEFLAMHTAESVG